MATRARRPLTPRQRALMELIARGLPNKEIATQMGISEQAVKEQISALLLRLRLRNRAALAEMDLRTVIVGEVVASGEWLPYLFRDAPMAMALLRGPDHVIEVVNERGRRGAGTRDLVDVPYRAAFPAGSAEVIAAIEGAYADGRVRTVPRLKGRWDRRHTGALEEGFFTVVVQPIPGRGASAPAVLVFAVDVTEDGAGSSI
jgi:DNA-binding CsgD family transcriptional regulator